jgi:hypothetical protein
MIVTMQITHLSTTKDVERPEAKEVNTWKPQEEMLEGK